MARLDLLPLEDWAVASGGAEPVASGGADIGRVGGDADGADFGALSFRSSASSHHTTESNL